MGLSLVAYYGPKPTLLEEQLRACQKLIDQIAGHIFQPYELTQVHATIADLTALSAIPSANAAFLETRGIIRTMDLPALFDFARTALQPPHDFVLGGFDPNRDYGFTSRKRHPFERSFVCTPVACVLIAWPVLTHHGSLLHASTLDDLRQRFQSYGVLHRYFCQAGDHDNDLYMRLGLCATEDRAVCEALESEVRAYLMSHHILFPLSAANVQLVRYANSTLALAETESVSLLDVDGCLRLAHTTTIARDST